MRKKTFLPLTVLLIAAAAWYCYYNTSFTFLSLNDAMDYASMGRNVARGDGFVSSYITPLGLANKGGLPHPDLWRAPLWPLVVGIFVRLLGATDQAVAIATGFFFIAGAWLVYLLGQELFDRFIGFLAALVYIFSAQNLVNSTSGMTETFSLFLMLLAVYLIVACRTQNAWGELMAGAALGLFYLARYNALLFVPFFVLLLWSRRRKSRPAGYAVGRYLAAFVLVISPWLLRNYLLMGSPLFSLQKYEPAMFTRTYPGYSMYMLPEKINVMAFLSHNPEQVWAKVVTGWSEFSGSLLSPQFTGVSSYLMVLFLVSLVIPFGGGLWDHHKSLRNGQRALWNGQRGLRPLILACFITQLAALLVIHFIDRLFFIFMPFYIIFGLAALVWLLKAAARRLPVREKTFVALFSLLAVGFFISTNLPSWGPLKQAEMPITGLRQSVKAVTDMTTRQSLIISNDGHLLAWYGDRYAAKLPYRVEMITDLEKLAPLKVIYLSSRISWNLPEADRSWARVYWSKPRELYGFRLARVFPDGSVIYRKE